MSCTKRICVALSSLLLVGCLTPENVLMTDVDMHNWDRFESVTYNNSDTLSLRKLNIAVRYNNDYKPTTLSMMVYVTTPDTLHFEEEITLNIHHPHSGNALATTESLPYRSNVVLAQKGYYIFAFTPHTEVRGIEAIGIEFK